MAQYQDGEQKALEIPRSLNAENVDDAICLHREAMDHIGNPTIGFEGYRLLKALKRNPIGRGPIPHVTLFEAANRILTDVVILRGVKYLLENDIFPFDEYQVEYGHENNNAHDIMASAGGQTLHGEAFNVAPSFFQTKKTAALRKLRASPADFNLLIVNSDVKGSEYVPQLQDLEHMLLIDVDRDGAETRLC